jgi:hypothetical protein
MTRACARGEPHNFPLSVRHDRYSVSLVVHYRSRSLTLFTTRIDLLFTSEESDGHCSTRIVRAAR